jgi:hypothetical protein
MHKVKYASYMGCIMYYLVCLCPNDALIVGVLARHLSDPIIDHRIAANRS